MGTITGKNKPNKIIIHCTATPKGRNTDISDINTWHQKQGYSMVGYHYVIKLDGTIQKGREEYMRGAHCHGQNTTSIGIAYVGGMSEDNDHPEDTRTEEQKKAMLELINSLRRKYKEKEGIILSIHGHNEFANKACPSYIVSKELGLFNIM